MAAVAAAKPAPAAAAANAPFVAAKKFGGKKAGYVFKKGAQGVGYYADVNKPVPTIGKEATPLEARQMVVMASRITPPPQPQPLDRLICKFMPLLRPSLVARVLTKERDDAIDRAAAADKVAAEAQHKLELAGSMETRRETAHAEHMRKVQKECANLQASVWVGNDRLKEAQEKLKVLQLKVLQLKEAQEKLLQLKMAQHQAEVEAHLETCAKLAAASARADACEAQLAVVNGQVARQDVPSKESSLMMTNLPMPVAVMARVEPLGAATVMATAAPLGAATATAVATATAMATAMATATAPLAVQYIPMLSRVPGHASNCMRQVRLN